MTVKYSTLFSDARKAQIIWEEKPVAERAKKLQPAIAYLEKNLRVNPVNAEAFECFSECGGALEFLEERENEQVQPVV